MFTGLVEGTGTILSSVKSRHSTRLTLRPPSVIKGLRTGDSLAINGTCLTVIRPGGNRLAFDVLEETLRKTNLHALKPGDQVNLERPLRADSRLGGHFVTGHVDGMGTVKSFTPVGSDYRLVVECPRDLASLLVYKGSIAIDGISLTVADVAKNIITIWIIPHTRKVTNLASRKAGDKVNLEMDILGKYVLNFMEIKRLSPRKSRRTHA